MIKSKATPNRIIPAKIITVYFDRSLNSAESVSKNATGFMMSSLVIKE